MAQYTVCNTHCTLHTIRQKYSDKFPYSAMQKCNRTFDAHCSLCALPAHCLALGTELAADARLKTVHEECTKSVQEKPVGKECAQCIAPKRWQRRARGQLPSLAFHHFTFIYSSFRPNFEPNSTAPIAWPHVSLQPLERGLFLFLFSAFKRPFRAGPTLHLALLELLPELQRASLSPPTRIRLQSGLRVARRQRLHSC